MLIWLGMCVDWIRAWQMLHPTIKQVQKPRLKKNWTILPEVLDVLFTNKVHSERWSSTHVSPSVVVATTTLQMFSLDSFWSLPTKHPQHHVLHCQVHELQWFSSSLLACAWYLASLPSEAATPDLVQLLVEQLPQEIVQFWREPTFPPEIAQIWLVACWLQKLCNPVR